MNSVAKLLSDLVRLPSINPMGASKPSLETMYEHRVSDYVESFIRSLGLPIVRQTVRPYRDNLIIRYENPNAPRTILLEVHQDTVPVEGMTIDPFGGKIRNGRVYGRGACDVKGSLAVFLMLLQRLVEEKPRPCANVILACTVDEEHTFLGVETLMQSGLRADLAIVAEPTQLGIVDCHKGVTRWKVRTTGQACHSSRPQDGINAIYRMSKLMQEIEQYATELSQFQSDARLGSPTLSVGRIEGGVSVNTVPDHCVIEIDRRLIPGEQPQATQDTFQAYLQQYIPDVPFVCEPIYLACPALQSQGSELAQHHLGRAIDAVLGSHRVFGVPFGTDASTIAEAGIPTVVFGPGDIAQAHTVDEWIEIAQMETAIEIFYHLVTQP